MESIRKRGRTIPFGYALSELDPTLLEPVEKELEALDEIIPLVKDKVLSLREAALYLEHKTGRSISHIGVRKIANNRYA